MNAAHGALSGEGRCAETEFKLRRRIATEHSSSLDPPQFWRDSQTLKVLGMGVAMPGPPVVTSELLVRLQNQFGIAISRRGIALGNRLGIARRHLCRVILIRDTK